MKRWKKWINYMMVAGVIPLLWATGASAASSAAITVTVTIQNISVSLSSTSWAIGPVAAGSVTTMTMANEIRVTNDGNIPENFTLSLTNPSGWTAGPTAGTNAYVMKGLFMGTADGPLVTDFGADDEIKTTSTTATASVFGYTGATSNGAGVPASQYRDLWLQFSAPTSTNVTTQQSITVTVGASP